MNQKKYYYDLHIHTCLSACAGDLMTPNNILNMVSLKKLDIIAITDHGSTKQLKTINELKGSYEFLTIPGLEITVKEGFHMLVYFYSFADAMEFDKIIEEYLVKEKYDSDRYGKQIITDIYDETIKIYPHLLSKPLSIGYREVIDLLKNFRRLIFLAHINRSRNSGISVLNKIAVNGIEVTKNEQSDKFILEHNLNKYKIIYDSDAHDLLDITERSEVDYLELPELTMEAFFRYFNG